MNRRDFLRYSALGVFFAAGNPLLRAQAPSPQCDENDSLKGLRIIDAHAGWVRAIAVSPDGRQFATCGNDNLVKLWNAADYSLIRDFDGHQSHVYNVAFHPSERMLVSGDLRVRRSTAKPAWLRDEGNANEAEPDAPPLPGSCGES